MRYPQDQPPVLSLTPGPVPVYPEVLHALSRQVPYDYDLPYQAKYERIVRKLQQAMRLSTRPLILQGEPLLGLEAAAASLIAAQDTVLILASGPYGEGFGGWARRYSRDVLTLKTPDDQAIDPQAVADMLKRNPSISVVSVCHHETPCGTINPINAIGTVVAEHGALLIVDAVSSFGGMNTHPEDCRAAIYVTGPAKCLGTPPALTLLGISTRAWAKMRANPTAPRGSVLSILDWEDAGEAGKRFPFTTSIADINALDAALDLYLGEGPEAVWARHGLTARTFRAGIAALGLSIWAAREANASPTTTVVRLPVGISEADLLSDLRDRYGLLVSGGRGPTAGRAIRVAHMGPAAHPLHAIAALSALAGSLSRLGFPTSAGQAIEAALQVVDLTT
ncbi:alanine--glyoxylate aminotransferase family protein [Tianweitania sp.]|uniref:pyridoxal-phosphate-dependent aminotransferase family protein n=1 Tax=Tianweitania sp. TaxID=2021634 RepID=UPI0028A0A938|nr:alanine--glyoxylate aminotransferase family protein [Tianweitania sp.]